MNYKELISQAHAKVAAASYSPKKLTLIHTGVISGLGLVTAVLSYVVGMNIDSTGGLGGIGTRAALETVQTLLQLLTTVVTPFWAMGFVAAALHYAHDVTPTPRTLMTGFFRFGPILRLTLLQCIMYFAVGIAMVQLGAFLYTLSPAADRMYGLIDQLGAAGTDTEALVQQLGQMDIGVMNDLLLGMLPFLLVPVLLAGLYLSYRMRFATYLLAQVQGLGAIAAIMGSFRLTKGKLLAMLKLDLRFWWFYALDILVGMLCYGDLLLALLGVHWGSAGTLVSFGFYVLALALQLGLYVWRKPQVMTSYALFFKELLPTQQEQPASLF